MTSKVTYKEFIKHIMFSTKALYDHQTVFPVNRNI